jgi:hypothetical protein
VGNQLNTHGNPLNMTKNWLPTVEHFSIRILQTHDAQILRLTLLCDIYMRQIHAGARHIRESDANVACTCCLREERAARDVDNGLSGVMRYFLVMTVDDILKADTKVSPRHLE